MATTLTPAQALGAADYVPGYTFGTDTYRYRNQATGRFVARRDILALLDRQVADLETRLAQLTLSFHQGGLSPAVFAAQMRLELRRSHFQHRALGAGGWDRLAVDDYQAVATRLAEDFDRVTHLITGVVAPTSGFPRVSVAQALNRVRGYAGASRIQMLEAERTHLPQHAAMVWIERRVLGAAEHCVDCVNYYQQGWQTAGVLPVPGVGSVCHTHCRCTLERREVPAADVAQWVNAAPVTASAAATPDDTDPWWAGKGDLFEEEEEPPPPPKIYDLSRGREVRATIAARSKLLTESIARTQQKIEDLTTRIENVIQEGLRQSDAEADPNRKGEIETEFWAQKTELQSDRRWLYEELEEDQELLDQVVANAVAAAAPPGTNPSRVRGKGDTLIYAQEFSDIAPAELDVLRDRVQTAMAYVNKVANYFNVRVEVFRDQTGKNRAFARSGGIYISPDTSISTIVHEIGHALESQRTDSYREKRLAFYNDRTAGDELRSMADDFPGRGYEQQEVYRQDYWLKPYIGKTYEPDDQPGNAASELISMGVQMLYDDPTNLYENDPEFFDFVVSYLQGTI